MEIYNQTEDSYTGKWYGDIEPNRGQLYREVVWRYITKQRTVIKGSGMEI